LEKWASENPPETIHCPNCGIKNLGAGNICRNCGENLTGAKETGRKASVKAHLAPDDPAFAQSEKRVALVPEVTTQVFSGFGWKLMEGSLILTNRRLVFVPCEISANTTLMAAAGALGGIVGALAASAAAKNVANNSDDLNKPVNEILRDSKHAIEISYKDLESIVCKEVRRMIKITLVSKTSGKKHMPKLLLSMPDGFRRAKEGEGIDRRRAWADYCDRCRRALESSTVGSGVCLDWTR
jgi:rRNA maturation endonuclease Nob1